MELRSFINGEFCKSTTFNICPYDKQGKKKSSLLRDQNSVPKKAKSHHVYPISDILKASPLDRCWADSLHLHFKLGFQ